MLTRVKDKFGLVPDWMIADTAYGSGPMLGWLVDRKIDPYIPVINKAGRPDGTWIRTDFEWDAENDQISAQKGTRSNSSAGITLIQIGDRRARAQPAIAP